jgi:hypothetical protein
LINCEPALVVKHSTARVTVLPVNVKKQLEINELLRVAEGVRCRVALQGNKRAEFGGAGRGELAMTAPTLVE